MNRDVLEITDGGTWLVETSSGTEYLLDLDARTLIRLPAESEGQAARDGYVSLNMRRDGQELPLLGILDGPVQVGRPAYFLLAGVATYVGYYNTTRETTPVTRISRLNGEGELAWLSSGPRA